MALTANRDIDHYVDQELRSFPVKAGAHIYKGALVGHVDGYARPLVAGDSFLGIAYEEIDNKFGDGNQDVRVYTEGDFGFPLPGVVAADLGGAVYGSADDTLTIPPGGNTHLTHLGRCVNVLEHEQIILRLRTFR